MIRRFGHILFALTLLTGCVKEDVRYEPQVTAPEEVAVAGTEGATVQFRIQSVKSWSLENTDTRYSVDPATGDDIETVVTLTVAEENPTRQSRPLTPLTILLEDGKTQTIKVTQRPGTVAQALFFFFIGTDLQAYFDTNLKNAMEVMTASIPGEGRVAAFCRRNGGWRIVELNYDYLEGKATEVTLKEYDQIDRSKPEFLTQVINDLKTLVPAYEYGITFGGHGTGWLPVGYSIYGPGTFRRMPLNVHETGPDGKPYPITRYFGEPGSAFNIDEIAASIAATQTRFHYIIFDDCFMSNIETLYTLRNSADYILASPCEIMGAGFPYHYVIPALFRENGTQSDLQEVCEKFNHYYLYEYDPYYRSGCIAMTKCDELETLAAAAKRIFTDRMNATDASKLQFYEGLTNHLFYDFRQWIEQAATNSAALQDFQTQFDATFPPACRLHTPSFFTVYDRRDLIPINYYSGVTCSAPSTSYPAEMQQTEWWQATH